VKRKVLRDTLILLCIDHQEKNQLQKSSADYFKKVNDLASESNKKPVLKIDKTDYYQEAANLALGVPSIQVLKQSELSYTPGIANGHPLLIKMPPRVHTI